jgi:hypothetical protein
LLGSEFAHHLAEAGEHLGRHLLVEAAAVLDGLPEGLVVVEVFDHRAEDGVALLAHAAEALAPFVAC